ncbi:MAG: L-serine ammonia-lyase [Arcanobacterium sp.]|nr:L-serine ammonia-lyase [Arcanobacterium sp.]
MLSVFDLFSIGIGPSSSHTVGPMRAAGMFVHELEANVPGTDIPEVTGSATTAPPCSSHSLLHSTERLTCTLYGSLGSTGKGHGSDLAVVLGLLGELPETVDPLGARAKMNTVAHEQRLLLNGAHEIDFIPARDIEFDGLHELPAHPNGLIFSAYDGANHLLLQRTYYSVGGGFVVAQEEFSDSAAADAHFPAQQINSINFSVQHTHSPAQHNNAENGIAPVNFRDEAEAYAFSTAQELLDLCARTGFSMAKVMLEREKLLRPAADTISGLQHIWHVMSECIDTGCTREGMLPGSLHVIRRAPSLHDKLVTEGRTADPLGGMDWITLYAMAVNEENAAGGRVVTAPTNGAAGVIPAVLRYYMDFIPGADEHGVVRFLLTAAAIGMIVKRNASISGAEVGCQGEVGAACSMAAGGLAAVLGGTPHQVENAAEIGMEHNLGLTCDPVGGYVQVPCIERNAIAAIKAVAAARTALRGDGSHIVSLDTVIKTMRDTGRDMQSKYKETSLGGLAVNVTEC